MLTSLPRALARFEDMLRHLTAERSEICAAMAFALDNAESGARAAGWAMPLSQPLMG